MHGIDTTRIQERKNALEEYIYDMRSKLDGRYASYVQSPEKTKLSAALSEAEDWLYSEEGEDATKSVYVAKLDTLKVLGDPVTFRFNEAEQRSKIVAQLRESINTYMSQATSGDEKYAHIDAKDKQAVVERCATAQKWLEDQIARQSERAKNADPVLTSADVLKRRDDLVYFAAPVMSRPKPRPPKVEGTTGTETPKSGQQTPKPEEQQKQEEAKDNGPPEMDID